MLNIYEIDKAIYELIDEETGEIRDYEAFAALAMARTQKIENAACWYKNLTAEAKALREEEKALAERRKRAEGRAEHLKKYIEKALSGEKLKTARTEISYRKSVAVEPDKEFTEWASVSGRDEFLRYPPPEVDKTALKKALETGENIPHAALVQRNNIMIK